MNIWPSKKKRPRAATSSDEPPTIDRLLNRSCNRDEFILLYSKLLQERMPGNRVEFVGESALRLVTQGGKESTTHLDNLWLKYKAGTEDRAELIDKYIRLAQALIDGDDKTPERQNIVPMIKDSQYLDYMRPLEEFATQHLCGDLWIVYAEDEPERIRTLKRVDIRRAGVDDSELRSVAIENLKRTLPPAEVHGPGPCYLMTAGGDYVASLLLLDYVWDQVAKMVSGDMVATVPARDVLLFAGSESSEGVNAMRVKSTEICNSAPHAISDTLIVRLNGTWSVFNSN
jgi:uncharacterized protein YtpQ (UPF0354 family)